jgi:hypothetical protein
MPSDIVSLTQINRFLPVNKLQLESGTNIDDLESYAISVVWAKLRTRYNLTGWVDANSTPKLVQTILSLLIAGTVYNRQFAEETTEGVSYGQQRIEEAYALLEGLLEGVYDLGDDVTLFVDPLRAPAFLITEPLFLMEEQW